MNVQEIISSMSRRVPWNVASAILYSLKLPRGRGWEGTFGHYGAPSKKVTGAQEQLEDALRDHILVGEKLISLYELKSADMKSLRKALETLQVGNDADPRFPYVPTGAELEEADPYPKLAAVVRTADGTAAVYRSRRSVQVRQDVDDEAKEVSERSDVSAVIAIVNVPFCAFDVVFVQKDGRHMELRMDHPEGATREETGGAVEKVLAAFREDVGGQLNLEPANLFPLIDSMHKDPNEGIVVEHHFNTTTGTTVSGRARRHSVNLRTDPYHSGGVKGLKGELELFSVTIRWSLPIDNKKNSLPELTLHIAAGERDTPHPRLSEITLRKCATVTDFEHVRDRIYHHLLTA